MLLSLIYDIFLLLIGIVALPRLVWQRIRHGKYKNSLRERLGLKLPPKSVGRPVIWIHAVSVGETRAVSALYRELRKNFPNASFVVSSVTETGHAEARRALPDAVSYFFLPLDFSWLMKKFVKRIQPDLLILVEGEFWYHLLKSVKEQGGKVLLVNGKLSERSYARFRWMRPFAEKLFSLIDGFCLQGARFEKRFESLAVPKEKIHVTGNLKLDVTPPFLSHEEKSRWKSELGIHIKDRVIVFGSTHAPEEAQLLSALDLVWKQLPSLKVIIVPRHPERFSKVAAELKTAGRALLLYSEREKKRGDERIILIDTMGLLLRCYQIAEVAIVGGSFVSHVGGHNIFEPVQAGVPVLFGPHMHTQQDLVELVLGNECGEQVSLESLPNTLLNLLADSSRWQKIHQNCFKTSQDTRGSTERTLKIISSVSL